MLIVGGGDCGIAEEVLKHKSVKRRHPGRDRRLGGGILQGAFPGIHRSRPEGQALRSRHRRRHELRRATTDRRFDVIIVDSTDPQGPGACCSRRNSMPAASAAWPGRRDGHAERRAVLPAGRADPAVGQVQQPVGRRHMLRRGDPDLCRRSSWRWAGRPTTRSCGRRQWTRIAERYAKAGKFKTRYWTPEVHKAAFALPRFIAEASA